MPAARSTAAQCRPASAVSGGDSSLLGDRVDERRLSGLDFGDRALECLLQSVGAVERSFGVPALCTRNRGEIGIGTGQIHSDVRTLDGSAALARHADLVLPVVV